MASLRRRLGALILFGFLFAVVAAPQAGAADAFTVTGIEVDVSAANVAQAREQALAEAPRLGFRKLLERLVVGDPGRLAALDGRQYVRDVSVEQERASAVRYLATLTVRYNPVAVRKLLRESGLKFTEPRLRPVVVVPLLRGAGGALPARWDEPNPWRAAWTNAGEAITGGLVPLVVAALPANADPAALPPPERLAAGDPQWLGYLGARFRSGDVVVAVATPTASGGVEVALTGIGLPRPFDLRTYGGEAGFDAALRAAVADIDQGFETQQRQQNTLSYDHPATQAVVAPLSGLSDWLSLRDRLGRVPQVRRWELVSLSRDEAALTLHTIGEAEQVRAALAAAGLTLEPGEPAAVLRLGGGAGR
jgi:hypothetical protein